MTREVFKTCTMRLYDEEEYGEMLPHSVKEYGEMLPHSVKERRLAIIKYLKYLHMEILGGETWSGSGKYPEIVTT